MEKGDMEKKKEEESEYQDVDTCIRDLTELNDVLVTSNAVPVELRLTIGSAIHWLEECTQKLSVSKMPKDKRSFPERLHDVFVQAGYCDQDENTALETGVALLIDDIIQEVREECTKK